MRRSLPEKMRNVALSSAIAADTLLAPDRCDKYALSGKHTYLKVGGGRTRGRRRAGESGGSANGREKKRGRRIFCASLSSGFRGAVFFKSR